ncbi:hypothetical protein HYPSUDRAFT_47266 [Hypholoma sublateritium FD-334 SS-4]|uniref:Peptidase C14 caspase domain-containing protein n=1 Tax=Hypholoma sublateritium (strain FD-334 SS-4) TaxID=945553 RepID=A0A0D2NIZ1_HYPSF|nr:hypothetical protein HYPSUDRAFT_47266 [Hypholoma sublateritium FD-334 SS-4]
MPVAPQIARAVSTNSSSSVTSQSESDISVSGDDASEFPVTPRDYPSSPTVDSEVIRDLAKIEIVDVHYDRQTAYRKMIPYPLKNNPLEATAETGQQIYQHSFNRLVSPSTPKETSEFRNGPRGRRKALCIGIDYKGLVGETLKGCVNDAYRMREFLIKYGNYEAGNITILSEGRGEESIPTKNNIMNAICDLVAGARKNDVLFFHYSGHGRQIADKDGDEIDSLDEVLVPVDYKRNGYILDDKLHEVLVKGLPEGCRLTALIDACHSGTMLDLPYNYHCNVCKKISLALSNYKQKLEDFPYWQSHIDGPTHELQICSRRTTRIAANVVSWSGCTDSQVSKEEERKKSGLYYGIMTNTFISCMESKPSQTVQELYHNIVLQISSPKNLQKPQLGVSHQMNAAQLFVF